MFWMDVLCKHSTFSHLFIYCLPKNESKQFAVDWKYIFSTKKSFKISNNLSSQKLLCTVIQFSYKTLITLKSEWFLEVHKSRFQNGCLLISNNNCKIRGLE